MSQSTMDSEKQFMTSVQESAGNPSIDYAVWLLTESGNVFVMLPFSIILLIIRKTRKIGMILLKSNIFNHSDVVEKMAVILTEIIE